MSLPKNIPKSEGGFENTKHMRLLTTSSGSNMDFSFSNIREERPEEEKSIHSQSKSFIYIEKGQEKLNNEQQPKILSEKKVLKKNIVNKIRFHLYIYYHTIKIFLE